jgi:hypothetical protein
MKISTAGSMSSGLARRVVEDGVQQPFKGTRSEAEEVLADKLLLWLNTLNNTSPYGQLGTELPGHRLQSDP